jgi:hypothetical protein
MATKRKNDRPLIAIALGVLVTVAIFFVGYSHKTSVNMDRMAVTTRAATNSDKAGDKPAGATPPTSNLPPTTSPSR